MHQVSTLKSAAAWAALVVSILCVPPPPSARAQVSVPSTQAVTTNLPLVSGDGFFIEIYPNYGGGAAPVAADLEGRTPAGTTYCPLAYFYRSAANAGVGSLEEFFARSSYLPASLRGLNVSNFTLRITGLLKVTRDLDRNASTPAIDVEFYVGYAGGFDLRFGAVAVTNGYRTSANNVPTPTAFAEEGLYPFTLLYAADANRAASLDFRWRTASTGYNHLSTDAVYQRVDPADRVLDFDASPALAGVRLTNQFQDLGILFRTLSGDLQVTSAKPDQFPPVTRPRVYGDPATNAAAPGELEFWFVEPGTTNASSTRYVDFFVIGATGAVVTAYDPANLLIHTSAYQGGLAARERVTLEHPTIARVRVSLGGGTNTAAIDRLSFITPTDAPDLIIVNLEAPAVVLGGQAFGVRWTAHNAGNRSVRGRWRDLLQHSPDARVGDDVTLRYDDRSVEMPAGATLSYTQQVTIGAAYAGSRYLIGITDYYNRVVETNEANNTFITPTPIEVLAADVTLESVLAPATADQGVTIPVTWIWRNLGTAPVPAGTRWYDYVYLATNAAAKGNVTLLLSKSLTITQTVLPGGTNAVSADVSLPLRTDIPPGAYFLVVKAAWSWGLDSTKTNNVLAVPLVLTQPPLPDLAVSSLVVPANLEAGQPVEIRWTVTNRTDYSAPGPWTETVSLSADNQPGSDVAVDSFVIQDGLGPHASVERVQTVVVPGAQAGQRWFVVTVDSQDVLPEAGPPENNSRIASAVSTITAADLVVENYVFPANAQYGQTADIAWTVRNRGTATAQANWIETLTLYSAGSWMSVFTVDRLAPLAPGASYTRTNRVTFPLHSSYQPADLMLALTLDPSNRQAESNDANNRTNSAPIHFTLPQLPDLAVVSITAPANALPGQTVPLAWVVTNRGNITAAAPWTERIYLSADANAGSDRSVATFTLNNPLAAGASAVRSQPVVVPQGLAGEQWFVVRVDSTSQVVESDENNNVTVASHPTTVAAALTLTLDGNSVGENAGTNALTGTLFRNTGLETNLVVSVTNSDPTKVTVPATVTIPAAQASATFAIGTVWDHLVDGSHVVMLTASAGGFPPAAATLTVTDSDQAMLSFEAPPAIPEGEGGAGLVFRNADTNQPLRVSLWSEDPWRLRVTNQVVIPAGARTASFELLATENDLFEGNASLRLLAVATNYAPVSAAVIVLDNDAITLGLAVAETTVSEGATGPATVGTVTRSPVTSQAVKVNFVVEPDSPLVRPSEVVIPANAASAQFNIYVRDDDLVNGTRTATLSARLVNALGDVQFDNPSTVTLQVLDNDGPSLDLAIRVGVISESGATSARVSRNTPPVGDLLINLSSSDTGEATVPASVTIPDGQTEGAFLISGVSDGASDGVQTASITASAPGYNQAVAAINVSDIDLPDLVISSLSVPTNALAGDCITITWAVTNLGLTAASGSWVDYVYASCPTGCRAASAVASASFSGTLAVGEGYTRSAQYVLPEEPGAYQIRVVTDAEQVLTEGSERNNECRASRTAAAAYHARAWTDVNATPNGTPIPIQGRAWMTRDTNSPAAFKPVKVDISVKRMRRTLTATTDANGEFQTVFTPLPTEAGLYTLGADGPGKTPAPVQDQFEILGMSASPAQLSLRLVPNTPLGGTLTLRNLSDAPLTGLGAIAVDAPADLQAQFSLTNDLPGDETVSLAYTFTATGSNAAAFEFQIHAQSAEGVFVDVPVKATVVPFRPDLASTPPYLERGMVRGQQATVAFELANNGGAPTGPLNVALPATSWLSLASAAEIPSLNPGDKTTVTLRLAPPDDLPLTRYDGSLVVAGPGAAVRVPFQFRAVSTAAGDLHVRVEDQYTYYVEGAPLVTNATVTVLDPFNNTVVAETNTAETGEATFANLLEGHYTIEVSVAQHAMYRSTLEIQPGLLNEFRAFLQRETVTYTWRVVPTEIEDHYRMVLESEFEADVPVPNVVVENPMIMPLVTPGEETQIEIRLRNEGLIAAHDVQMTKVNHPYYEVIPLVRLISVMPAKSRMTIPAIIRLRGTGLSPGKVSPAALPPCPGDGEQCMPSFVQPVTYYYQCGADGILDRRAIDMMALCHEKAADDCFNSIVTAAAGMVAGGGIPDPCDVADAVINCRDKKPPPCVECLIKAACSIIAPEPCTECLCRIVNAFMDSGEGEGNPTGPAGAPPGGPPASTSGWSFPGDRGDCLGAGGGKKSLARSPANDTVPSGVCAHVRIQIEQEAVMTRAAFIGTLTIESFGSIRLNDVRVDLDFRDAAGNPAADRFGVRGPNCTGMSDVAGGGQVVPGIPGTARYTFVPTRDAAPDAPTVFWIGGTLRYSESGREVTVPLLPASITVLPEARLVLQYFQQRDVFSDDPFTPEIEPAEPFALGLIAKNIGAGWARNFRITSAQPKIVENEKGLMIDFKIIGTQVGTNAGTPSLTADLGNIGPGRSQVARWLLTSSLQGKFIDYSATFEHRDWFGATNVSLIEGVEIHELIKAVLADRPGDDLAPDFLVNDDPDAYDLPDTLYLSDGTVALVNLASNPAADGAVHAGAFEVHLTASMTTGWNYFSLPDPGARFALYRAVRSDGKELRVGDNIWQTDRTFPSSTYGVEREWRLHVLDFDGTGAYTLYYRVIDTESPSLAGVVGPAPALQTSFVAAVDVVFSEPIDLATFGYEDLLLTVNGGDNLINGDITLDLLTNATYRIGGLAAFTADDGNYEFTVLGAGIQDYAGNAVVNSASTTWAKGENAPVVVTVGPVSPNLRTGPVATVDVVFSRSINPATLDFNDLALSLDGSPNLINDTVTVAPLSGTTFRITGLEALTAADGWYVLTVAAGGVEDSSGVPGVGALSHAWTKDSTPPVIASLEDIATNPRSIVVMSLDVAFTEPIAASSFDWQDLSLRRNHGVNLISSDVTVTPISPAVFRIANFNWACGYEGNYTLTVNAAGVTDLAGNPGAGAAARSWEMDTTAPAMPFNLGIAPDTGVSASDRLVNTNRLVLTGAVADTNVTVRIYDTGAAHDLGEAAVASGAFSQAIDLSEGGRHRLRVRAVDAAGNTSSNVFLDVFVDLSPPVITLDAVTPNPRTNAVAAVNVRFSEAIDTNAFDWVALSLTLNGGSSNLINSNTVALRVVASNLVQILRLEDLTDALGVYELVVWPEHIVDLAGNPAAQPATNTWRRVGENSAPRLDPIPVQTIAEGNWLSFVISATDTNQPPNRLSFALDGVVPSGVTLGASSGLFRWRPTEAQGPGAYLFTARVTDDGLPPMSDLAEFTVLVEEANQPPVIAPLHDKLVYESFTLWLPIAVTDADLPANPLTYALAPGAPSGMSVGPLDGVLVWTPTEAECGTSNRVTVLVSDNGTPNYTATNAFTVVALCLKPGLNLPRRAPGGGWEFTFKGDLGHHYRLETSDDLETWNLVFLISATDRIFTVTDPDPLVRACRYYRAVEED